jgi:hypothetical protein
MLITISMGAAMRER